MITRLEDSTLGALVLDDAHGYLVESLDLGDAETRAVVLNAPDADGTIDSTRYIGARTVTMRVVVTPGDGATVAERIDRLRAFTSPRARPFLYVAERDQPERRIQLRRGQWASPLGIPEHRQLTVQWVAPLGILESADLHSALARPSSTDPPDGREYDLEFDREYPSAEPSGSVLVVNAGNVDAYPVIRIYGPCDDPGLEHESGAVIEFDGLSVAAGEYVELDVRARTIRYLSNPADSRYSDLKFPTSSWWTLAPGSQRVRFFAASVSAPAGAVIEWRDAWL